MNILGWFRFVGCLGFLLYGNISCSKSEAPSPESSKISDSPKLSKSVGSVHSKSAPPAKEALPAPKGTIFDSSLGMWVQICGDVVSCPTFFQEGGEAHCKALTIGSLDTWQLPSKETLSKLKSNTNLKNLSGYHWSSSPYSEDPLQFWIVDPAGKAPSTTIPKKRKKFRVRCVRPEDTKR